MVSVDMIQGVKVDARQTANKSQGKRTNMLIPFSELAAPGVDVDLSQYKKNVCLKARRVSKKHMTLREERFVIISPLIQILVTS